jgi:hypothetical protein
VTPKVGLLFVDFATLKRLRVNGVASIDESEIRVSLVRLARIGLG